MDSEGDFVEDPSQTELGYLLLASRIELELTQEAAAAELAGVSRATISRWEKGESIEPLIYAIKLALRAPNARITLQRILNPEQQKLLLRLTSKVDQQGRIIDTLSEAVRKLDHRFEEQQGNE